MIKALQLEWKKFRKNSVVQMLIWIFIIFFPSLVFIGKNAEMTEGNPLISPDTIFSFPGIWEWLGWDGNWMVFFALGFLMVYMISIEMSYKTMRQNIITGMTRTQYFIGKLAVLLSFALFATLLYFVVGLAIGYVHTEDATFSMAMDNQFAIPRYFLMCLAYLSFAMFIGFAIKNSGLAVLTYLSYGILLEPMIRWLGHSQLTDSHFTMHYYPMNAAEDLMPMPSPDFMKGATEKVFLTFQEATILSLIYTTIFIVATYLIFTKRDM